ncbi:sensor histidine kinase [Panacibacter ginsenosidivorans]|nr:sensor histidine kinase [Panacibacter ginsenosidivorans]
MPTRFFNILICLFFTFSSLAQDYNYQHYDLTNGLSGLTVYSMVQDNDGYLWFGTETGLSRFDGIHFKNFTTADGLTDNEVLKLYVDSKNRIWIISFTNSVCYYKNGVIYSPKNDPVLAKIKFSSEPRDICEDSNGNIILIEISSIHIIDTSGSIHYINNYQSHSFINNSLGNNSHGNIAVLTTLVTRNTNNLGELQIDKNNFSISYAMFLTSLNLVNTNTTIRHGKLFVYPTKGKIHINIEGLNVSKDIDIPPFFTSLSYLNDSLITINCTNKILLYNINQWKILSVFAISAQVNSCFKDTEGNYWFATNGYGIYRLGSLAFKNYDINFNGNLLPVYSIVKNGHVVSAGTNNSLVWKIDLRSDKLDYTKLNTNLVGRVTSLIVSQDKLIAGASGVHFILRDGKETALVNAFAYAVKNIFTYDDKLLVATGRLVFEISKKDSSNFDTIWNQRATCAYKFDSLYYIGTIHGLYKINQNKEQTFIGDNESILASRISQLSRIGDTLWIATYGNGVVGYANNKIFVHITESEGLTSNMCRVITAQNHYLLVGTDKGLNKISFEGTKYKISKYTSSNGLNCDIINCVYTENDTIYIGTPYGLTFFDPSKVDNNSISVLNIDNVISKKHKWSSLERNFYLSADDNNLSVDFSCVSFKSQGNITYYYRLSGVDTEWRKTKENKLDFPSLSSGNYILELYAVNAFGKKSNSIKITFSVGKFFYQESWFIGLLVALTGISIWFLVVNRIKKIQNNEKEKLKTQKRLSELEQMAFRAQMNPHFIFNCLNSIQQYIFSKSIFDANKFITEFASLIRQTMDISARSFISLDEEIKYLTTYLKLEYTRFEENFDYTIIVAPNMRFEGVYLPPLLLQPFVENSIRHGIRNLAVERGIVTVNFSIKNQFLVCVIEDNGIGRASAAALKTFNKDEHQSKGMSIIEKRIEVLNSENAEKITMKVEDAFPEEVNKGTRITLYIPI